MLKGLFKKEPIEANSQKAIKAFEKANDYHKQLSELTIRSKLERGPSTLDEIFVHATCCRVSPFYSLPGNFKREIFGALEVFAEKGLVASGVNEEGKAIYYLTRSGTVDRNWGLTDVDTLKELVREYPTLFYS